MPKPPQLAKSPICGAKAKKGPCGRCGLKLPDGSYGRCAKHGGRAQQGVPNGRPPLHGLYASKIKNVGRLRDFLDAPLGMVDDEIRLQKALHAEAIAKAEQFGYETHITSPDPKAKVTWANGQPGSLSRTWRTVIDDYTDRISRLERIKAEIEARNADKQNIVNPGDIVIRVVRPVTIED